MPNPLVPTFLEIPGPAFIKTRNAVIYTKGNVVVADTLTTFAIESAQVGKIEEREDLRSVTIKFTPAGKLSGMHSVLWPYGSVKPGNLVHGVARVASIDTGTEIITFDSLARFRDGAPVRFTTRGTAPTGLTHGTQYFLHKLSSTTGTLHTTEANALAASSAVNISSAGTGEHAICEEEYLIVWGFDGNKYTFHNTALVGMPDFIAAANATGIGEVTFEAFRAFNTAATNVASIYTAAVSSPSDTSFDPADIITELYDVSWGSSAPWSAMQLKEGARVAFSLDLAEVVDVTGLITRKITALDATVTARPLNVTRSDLLAKLVMQSTGAGRGRRLAQSDALNIASTTASSFYFRLYAAILKAGPINHDRMEEPVGDLTWSGGINYATGVAQPLFAVGTVAPS